MPHYVIVLYNAGIVRRVLRALQRNNARILGIAILIYTDSTSVLGGVKNIDRENIVTFKGYIPLPQS